MKSAVIALACLLPVVASAQTCPSDDDIATVDGLTVARFYTDALTGVVSLVDVHPAAGAFAPDSGEGVLFTQSTASGIGAIGRLDADGNFVDWLVEPTTEFPTSAYLTTGHDGNLYACDTVDLYDAWRIEPDGTFENIADHRNCEGVAYGDVGEGPNVFVSSWTSNHIVALDADEQPAVIYSPTPPTTVGLAVPDAASAFPMAVYLKQQSGPVHALSYQDGGYDLTQVGITGYGEEISFSPPDSVFGDFLYALKIPDEVVRMDPSGEVTVVASGGGLAFSNHSTGAAFSTDGQHYYFTNEQSVIWRLSRCIFDEDEDGVEDADDVCPSIPDDQTDTDNDGQGDACDDDDDNDGTLDTDDNCPLDANQQIDTDDDGQGDTCDDDDDNDGILDDVDNCPTVDNEDQANLDDDLAGDVCDDDDDNDGTLDDEDNCPALANDDQTNSDDDPAGDACDDDDDNDGVLDDADCAPTDSTVSAEWTYYADADGDGFGDPASSEASCTAEPPTGFARDNTDNCPDVSNPLQENTDDDALGDACDPDDDGDGALDDADNCPLVDNPGQDDLDEDGTGDACDGDDDGDDINNDDDNCPRVDNAGQDDLDEDGTGDACDTDADGDGVDGPEDCDDADDDVSDWLSLFVDDDDDGVGTEAIELCAAERPAGYAEVGGDNCPDTANPEQVDTDEDGVGDACDDDPIEEEEEQEPDTDNAELSDGRCDCSTAPPTGQALGVLMLSMVFVRRRRQHAA